MKKLLLLMLCVSGIGAMAQETQQIAAQPQQTIADRGRTIRLHVYTTYAFDDKVDSYYSSSEYFEGTLKADLSGWRTGIHASPGLWY